MPKIKIKTKQQIRTNFADDVDRLAKHFWAGVIAPALKDIFSTIINDSIDSFLYGSTNTRRRRSRSSIYSGSRRDYKSYSRIEPRKPALPNPEDILFETRSDALSVLDSLNDYIERYGVARLSDFYDLCSISSDFTEYRRGWRDLSSASVVHTRDGFIIDFPTPSRY